VIYNLYQELLMFINLNIISISILIFYRDIFYIFILHKIMQ